MHPYILLKSCTDLANRGEESSKSTHLINVDIKDNHEDALLGGRAILQLAQMVCGKYISTSYSLLLTVCIFSRSKHRKISITKYRRSLSDLLNGIQHIRYFTRLHTIRITVFYYLPSTKKKCKHTDLNVLVMACPFASETPAMRLPLSLELNPLSPYTFPTFGGQFPPCRWYLRYRSQNP